VMTGVFHLYRDVKLVIAARLYRDVKLVSPRLYRDVNLVSPPKTKQN